MGQSPPPRRIIIIRIKRMVSFYIINFLEHGLQNKDFKVWNDRKVHRNHTIPSHSTFQETSIIPVHFRQPLSTIRTNTVSKVEQWK